MAAPALSEWTTLGLGGPAADMVEARDVAGLVAALDGAQRSGQDVLVLGGGSNLVVADEGFPGMVVRMAMTGVRMAEGDGGTVAVSAFAGEDWSALVERCAGEGLSGLECLIGIPGQVGATPVQNVGAYGQEVARVITSVSVWDRARHEAGVLAASECGFGYRNSRFKNNGRYVVTEVTFALQRSGLSQPVQYAELAARLGVPVGERVPLEAATHAVLALRRSKGMVLDPADPDTRSAGSFFMNPVLTEDQLSVLLRSAPDVPRWRTAEGAKVAAAWLVEKAGFAKGYRRGTAAISSKHALALTVRQGGTTADLLALAREVRNGVQARFGVVLQPEPLLVGAHL